MSRWQGFRMALAVVSGIALGSLTASAAGYEPLVTQPVDEAKLVTLDGNTPPLARDPAADRGPVDDAMRLDHMLLVLRPAPTAEAELAGLIDRLHDPKSTDYHHWLTAAALGERYGAAPADRNAVQRWLTAHGLAVDRVYRNGLVIAFSGTAGQLRETFHTELHRLAFSDGSQHLSNVRDPQIPAALAPLVQGVASLNDFFPRPRSVIRGKVAYDHKTGQWQPRFDVPYKGQVFHTVSPYDFDTIYNVLPLWKRGFTGAGITIAAVEDTNLANPTDWATFRKTFGLDKFTKAKFSQTYPGCANPGQNGDEIEAALDVEWASAAAPDATIELAACPDGTVTSGIDTSILGLLDYAPPDIISDSYGACETFSGQAYNALQNREAEIAAALGVTLFIAEGDVGPDECAIFEQTSQYSQYGITGGDNTASSYAVDVGGTDFMAQYNADLKRSPVSRYWRATNDPTTLASALSYIPEIPWNDSCASHLIFSDPVNGSFKQAYGADGYCNSAAGSLLYDDAGSGGPSTCFTGVPAVHGLVGGTCKGNPKPRFQKNVPGIPDDGERDQPDISLFAATGIWGSFLVECLSDENEGGAPCTADNDALLEGGGGTSFAAPAMAGIQALINQKYGDQGNANYVYYKLAAHQFAHHTETACNASRLNGNSPEPSCVFNDVTVGSIAVPCGPAPNGKLYDCYGATSTLIGIQSRSNTVKKPAFRAHIGYDLATGLGSVNATNLFDKWSIAGD